MLNFEQIKSIENALGTDKAGPIIQALETVEERVKATMVHELATKCDLAELKTEIIKWVAGMLLAQAAIIATLVKLL
jgi:hypothetical protein